MAANKRQGIRLILGGAPNTPHTLAGLRGFYRPDVPTPVGQPGDVIESLDEAKKAVADRKDVIELVEIPAGDVKAAEQQIEDAITAGAEGIAAARRDGRASDDASRFADEKHAVEEDD